MAYTDTQNSRHRTATIVSVAAIHAALGYALLTGFAATVIDTVTDNVKTSFIEKPDVTVPLPPPPPTPDAAPKSDPIVQAPDPIIKVPVPRPVPDVTFTNEFDTTVIALPSASDGLGKVPLPTPKLPGIEPMGATPRNAPGEWVTPDDYPSRPLRQGIEGTVGFRLAIGADGRVDNCTITRSSGNAELDAAACKQIARRARFDAARDSEGVRVKGSYENSVRWVIPR
ncbi:energy transducer TonB [Croceicoccus mobilis]|uniref:TonB C-terminal domain-containing protein n=1 Tax=Croceicoccus mobilis TaxID=1703339 RepID=A0A917DT82_9SPHN|nr:energy transducer TonB [Croceicoccus mobilis]GGD64440.1 hypothetical protein GCM10010990_12350 [Croceicoccus mobilis]